MLLVGLAALRATETASAGIRKGGQARMLVQSRMLDSSALSARTALIKLADSIASEAGRRSDSAYATMLKEANAQLAMRWTPMSVFVTAIGILVGVVAILAAVVLFVQGADYRRLLKRSRTRLDAAANRTEELERRLQTKLAETTDLVTRIDTQAREMLQKLESAPQEAKAQIMGQFKTLLDLLDLVTSGAGTAVAATGTAPLQKTVHLTDGQIESRGQHAIGFRFVAAGFQVEGDIGDFYHMNVMNPTRGGPPISLAISARGFNVVFASATIDGRSFPKVTLRGMILVEGTAPSPAADASEVAGPFIVGGHLKGYEFSTRGGLPDEYPPVFEVTFTGAGTCTASLSQLSEERGTTVVVTKLIYRIGRSSQAAVDR